MFHGDKEDIFSTCKSMSLSVPPARSLLDPKKSLAEHISATAQPSTWPFSDHTLQMHLVVMWVSVQTLSQQGLKWTNQKPIFLGDSQMSQH